MAVDLFELQRLSAQLWPTIVQALAEARAGAEAERDAAVEKCNAVLDKLADPTSTKEDIDAEAKRTEKERLLAQLAKEKAALEEAVAAKQKEIDEASKAEVVEPSPVIIAKP